MWLSCCYLSDGLCSIEASFPQNFLELLLLVGVAGEQGHVCKLLEMELFFIWFPQPFIEPGFYFDVVCHHPVVELRLFLRVEFSLIAVVVLAGLVV